MGVLIGMFLVAGGVLGLVIGGSIGFVRAKKGGSNKIFGTLIGMVLGLVLLGAAGFGVGWLVVANALAQA